MTDRARLILAMLSAAKTAMPPWQARLFDQMLRAAEAGNPLAIRFPRCPLPPITAHKARLRPVPLSGKRARQVIIDDPQMGLL